MCSSIDRYIVLYLNIVSKYYIRRDYYILTDIALLTKCTA